MTRRTRNKIAVLLAVAGLGAALWWQGRREVRVTFAGVSPHDASLVWFTVSNCSRTPLVFFKTAQEHHSNTWIDLDYVNRHWVDPQTVRGSLPGHSATNIRCSVTYLKPWRVEIAYADRREPSLIFRARTALARTAQQHNWNRTRRWLAPVRKWEYAHGPKMIAHQPAPPDGRPFTP